MGLSFFSWSARKNANTPDCIGRACDVQDCLLETFLLVFLSSMSVVKEQYLIEFNTFAACLEKHNTRLDDSRKMQKRLLDC